MPPRIQKTPAPEEVTQTDGELIFNALMMWANLVETGNPHISAVDAQQMRKPFKAMSADGMALVMRLRALANGIDITLEGTHRLQYKELEHELRELPMTWYPAILSAVVEAAHAHKTFKPGQIHIFVKGVEDKCLMNQPHYQERHSTEASSPANPPMLKLKRCSKAIPPASG